MNTAAEQPISSADASGKQSLLDHAETLFSTHGYDGVSLRELTRQAGTNLASVNYHFGSKEKLFEEVVLRRVRPLNERRLGVLQRALDEAGNEPPKLEAILEAFARPLVVGLGSAQRESLRRMAVRMFMDSDPLMRPLFEREFFPIARQFHAAIARARPLLSPRQLESGMCFFAGAMINLLAAEKRKGLFPCAIPPPSDEEMLQDLVRFGVAGFAGLSADAGGLPISSLQTPDVPEKTTEP